MRMASFEVYNASIIELLLQSASAESIAVAVEPRKFGHSVSPAWIGRFVRLSGIGRANMLEWTVDTSLVVRQDDGPIK